LNCFQNLRYEKFGVQNKSKYHRRKKSVTFCFTNKAGFLNTMHVHVFF
jgi:hypothetical protein